jgi:hypothetical protein
MGPRLQSGPPAPTARVAEAGVVASAVVEAVVALGGTEATGIVRASTSRT